LKSRPAVFFCPGCSLTRTYGTVQSQSKGVKICTNPDPVAKARIVQVLDSQKVEREKNKASKERYKEFMDTAEKGYASAVVSAAAEIAQAAEIAGTTDFDAVEAIQIQEFHSEVLSHAPTPSIPLPAAKLILDGKEVTEIVERGGMATHTSPAASVTSVTFDLHVGKIANLAQNIKGHSNWQVSTVIETVD